MDLLKGITRELRGDDERAEPDGRSRTAANAGRGGTTASGDTVAEDDEASGPGGDSDATPDARTGDRSRDDEHVCSFCGTEFDASRGACPDCDAEIVLRGQR